MTNNVSIIYFDIFIPANNNMTNNVRQTSNSYRTMLYNLL